MTKSLILCGTDNFFFTVEAWYAESRGYAWIPNSEVKYGPVESWVDYAGTKISIVNVFGTTVFKKCNWADLVIGYTPEVISTTLDPQQYIDLIQYQTGCPNTVLIAGGIPLHWSAHPRVYSPTLGCFDRVCIANFDYNVVVYQSSRPFLFEALLGQPHIPRQWLSQKIQTSSFVDKTLLSVSGSKGPRHFYRSPALNQLDHSVISSRAESQFVENAANLEMPNKKYFGLSWPVNCFIPPAIYENSWFSIISETDSTGSMFFTEKIGKALYGQRIFVLFGAPGALSVLKQHGYKTFGELFDESYDNIVDDEKRWLSAWQTVCDLAKMNPDKLYHHAWPILHHNYKLIQNIQHRHQPIQHFINTWLHR